MDIVKEIRSHIRFKSDDYRQVFWIGVFEALSDVDWSQDPIKYLVIRGTVKVRNYIRTNNCINYHKICNKCGKSYHYRAIKCSCGGSLSTKQRYVDEIEEISYRDDEVILDKIVFESFIDTLEGVEKEIAKKWIIDRADLYFDNMALEIANDLGITERTVLRYKKKIREKFQEWYNK